MRKYILSLFTVLALFLFTVMAVAQTPGGTTGINQSSGNNEGNSSNWNINKSASQSSAPVTGSATDPYSVHAADNANQNTSNTSGTNGSPASNSAMSANQNGSSSTMSSSNQADTSNGAKTLEGCVVKENTDYFIQPATGERERLTGSQDLSSSVGKNVRVEGSEQNSTSAANTGPNVGTTAPDKMPNSGPGSSETMTNSAGSIAGNAGSTNATGSAGNSASSSGNRTWTGKDFVVTKVETVSESCPADIQNKINQQSNGSNNPQ